MIETPESAGAPDGNNPMRIFSETVTVRFTVLRLMAALACFAVPMAMVHEAIYSEQPSSEFSEVGMVALAVLFLLIAAIMTPVSWPIAKRWFMRAFGRPRKTG